MAPDPEFDLEEDDLVENDEGQEGELGEDDAEIGDIEGQEDGSEEGSVEEGHGRQAEVGRREGKLGRGQNRFQKLSNENRELRDRLDALERTRQQAPQPSAYDLQRQRQEEQERLALMSPDERADYRIEQAERRTDERLRQIELRSVENTNKAAFQAKATVDPVYKKYAQAVEDKIRTLRAENPGQQFYDREIVLKVIIGERVLSKGGQATGRSRRRAEGSVRGNSAGASAGRGDVQGQRGRGGKSAAERLKGQFI